MDKCEKSTGSVFDNFKISRIYIVGNAIAATFDNLYVTATRNEDEFYMQYKDDELLELDPDEIRRIEEPEALHNIHKLYLDGGFDAQQPLTDEQLDRLNAWYSFVDPSKDVCNDIESILNEIKSAILGDKLYDRTEPDLRWKDYAESKGVDLNMDDCRVLLMNLTSDQFTEEKKCRAYWKSENYRHCFETLAGRLLEFEYANTFTTHAGLELSDLKIYIKIQKQISNGYIVFVSLHDPRYEDYSLDSIATCVISELNHMCKEGKWLECTDIYFDGDYRCVVMNIQDSDNGRIDPEVLFDDARDIVNPEGRSLIIKGLIDDVLAGYGDSDSDMFEWSFQYKWDSWHYNYLDSVFFYDAIGVKGRPVFATNIDSTVDREVPDDKKGGIIVFASEVNGIRLSKDQLVNWFEQDFSEFENWVSGEITIDETVPKRDLVGWTIGNFFGGSYTGEDGNVFSEDSLSVELVGVTEYALKVLAEELCCSFCRALGQEIVIVKLYSEEKQIRYGCLIRNEEE